MMLVSAFTDLLQETEAAALQSLTEVGGQAQPPFPLVGSRDHRSRTGSAEFLDPPPSLAGVDKPVTENLMLSPRKADRIRHLLPLEAMRFLYFERLSRTQQHRFMVVTGRKVGPMKTWPKLRGQALEMNQPQH